MGAGHSRSSKRLEQATLRAEDRIGKHHIVGRYHRLPRRIEDDYVLDDVVLGEGYSGPVRLARSRQTDAKYAVKSFKTHGVPKERKEELISETEIFLSMDHPHVARLVDAFETSQVLYLVMECLEGGELYDRVIERKMFTEHDAAIAVRQMLIAVIYIHSRGVVHRDLKLENFLYESRDSDHLKLIDFGFSNICEPNTKMAMCCGTLSYVAPEVLMKSYTSQCDLWSLGVITFILLVGHMPFSGPECAQVLAIKKGAYSFRQERWSKVSAEAFDFVRSLLVVDPQVRMNAETALQHEWMLRGQEENHVDQTIIDALCQYGSESRFRRACMCLMAWSLTNEERSQVRDAFIQLDTSKTGTIKLKDLRLVLENQFSKEDTEIARVIGALDSNNDEEINYSEFLAAMVSSRIQLHDGLLLATFKRFDTDNSGFITLLNLREVLGESFDGVQIDELIQEADFRMDGRISLEEFVRFLTSSASDSWKTLANDVIDKEVRAGFESPFQFRRRTRATMKRVRRSDGGLRHGFTVSQDAVRDAQDSSDL